MSRHAGASVTLACRAGAIVALACLAGAFAAGCRNPLPEEESAEAKLYASRCGTCHAPHQPRALTPAMWKVQVDRMDQKFRDARIQPPSADEKEKILAYLTRHAGG